jgi:hypothetical protein
VWGWLGLAVLRLEVSGFEGAGRWRWVLTGPGGKWLADHQVDVDTSCWEFEAFTDLQGYLRWHTAPDRRLEEEAQILAGVGAWAGREVLGPVAGVLVKRRGAVVRVVVGEGEPQQARRVLFLPLELAYANGRALAAQNVTLVMEPPGGDQAIEVVPVGGRLRVLGLFSLPVGGRPLNLRRERQALVRLFGELAGAGRAVDVRVLQYGVTRGRLAQVLEEAEGWDVIHISGHGAPGELELETAEGGPDPVTAEQMVDMLEAAGPERVKLVSVSACWSAALTLAEQRRLLRLPDPETERSGPEPVTPQNEDAGASAAAGGLAVELASRLGCAVLAMRFPVVDGFAIALAGRFYELVAGRGQPVARAVGIALADPEVVPDPPTLGCPPLSVATPALFGAAAADLILAAPARSGPVGFDPRGLKLAGWPAAPERFVGRTAVMARASGALAPRSSLSGVVLHGMPGGGKTACALELGYTHEDAFGVLVWFKAPDQGRDIADALTRFALTLETSLPGLQLVDLLEDQAKLTAFLPVLTELMERNRILVVIDNAESLLTDNGGWRDARWGMVVSALAGHAGLGRVVITSRRVPAGLDGRVRVLGVDALSADEALLLARELPHLSALIDGQVTGLDADTARSLAAGVLEVAQGHPKLLELADGQAAHPDNLRALVEAAGQAWREAGGLPEGFFATGETTAGGEDFLQVLAAWTKTVAAGLTPPAKDLFCFVCCLEEDDRVDSVLEGNWADLWKRLGRADPPPGLDENLAAVAAAGLAAAQPGPAEDPAKEYGVHPGVAAAGRDLAGLQFRQAADTELAAFWVGAAHYAMDQEAEEDTSGLVVRAGLSAAPYLLRRHAWDLAQGLLENALIRDHSRATAGAALPALRAIANAVKGTDDEPAALGVLARALAVIDPAAADHQMEAVLASALRRKEYRNAAVATGYLIIYRRQAGRLGEALQLATHKADYTKRAGLGPWTQLSDQVQRLQILNAMGQAGQVVDEVRRLRGQMDRLPATSELPETVTPWDVREALLDTGRQAGANLGRWAEALELNAAAATSMRARGAPDTEVARMRFNDYGPLLRLGRTGDAVAVLIACREIFEAAHDIQALGTVLGALADAEDDRGHGDVAIGLERDALRYKYLAADVSAIQTSHHNLGNYLAPGGQLGAALTHHLASALLRVITGAKGELESSARAAAAVLRAAGEAALPADTTALCERVGEVPGVHLDRLLAALAPSQGTAEQAFQDLVRDVRAQAAAQAAPQVEHYLARWDPVAAGLAAAGGGDTKAGAAVREYLAGYADSDDWAGLAGALTQILDGGRGQDLAAGLDAIDTAVVARALDAVTGRISLQAALWPAMGLGRLLGDITDAAHGNAGAAPRARQMLDALAGEAGLADLAAALDQVLGGSRDPGLPATVGDDTGQAVVACVLEHISAGGEPQEEGESRE